MRSSTTGHNWSTVDGNAHYGPHPAAAAAMRRGIFVSAPDLDLDVDLCCTGRLAAVADSTRLGQKGKRTNARPFCLSLNIIKERKNIIIIIKCVDQE